MLLNLKSTTPLADGIKRVVFEERRNYNILITGKTQLRKSTTAVKLCRELNPKFDLEKHMAVIQGKKLLEILKNEPLKRGDVVLADDFGVGMDHRKWFSFMNKAINYSMMTHGFKGIILIVTVPYEKYIDSDTKLLFDMQITVLRKNDKEKYSVIKVEELQHVTIKKDVHTYKHFPRGFDGTGIMKMVEAIMVKYPDEKTMKKYFEISSVEKNNLYHSLDSDIKEIEKTKNRKNINLEVCVDKIMQNPGLFVKKFQHRKFISNESVMDEFNVGLTNAKRIKASAENRLGDKIAEIQPSAQSGYVAGNNEHGKESKQ